MTCFASVLCGFAFLYCLGCDHCIRAYGDFIKRVSCWCSVYSISKALHLFCCSSEMYCSCDCWSFAVDPEVVVEHCKQAPCGGWHCFTRAAPAPHTILWFCQLETGPSTLNVPSGPTGRFCQDQVDCAAAVVAIKSILRRNTEAQSLSCNGDIGATNRSLSMEPRLPLNPCSCRLIPRQITDFFLPFSLPLSFLNV